MPRWRDPQLPSGWKFKLFNLALHGLPCCVSVCAVLYELVVMYITVAFLTCGILVMFGGEAWQHSVCEASPWPHRQPACPLLALPGRYISPGKSPTLCHGSDRESSKSLVEEKCCAHDVDDFKISCATFFLTWLFPAGAPVRKKSWKYMILFI